MKLKKYSYLLVFIIMLLIGIDKTHAEARKSCYYMSSDNNFKVELKIGYDYDTLGARKPSDFAEAKIHKLSETNRPLSTYEVKNWFKNSKINGVNFEGLYNDRQEANKNSTCPMYIVYVQCPRTLWFDKNTVLVTNNSSLASSAISGNNNCSFSGYASNYKNGKQITKDIFYEKQENSGNAGIDKGDLECEELIDSDVKALIDQILGYVRIIVPILIITLGIVDFGKAVLANKEDEMKKAQSTFIKRLIAGVAVFLVPTFIDIIIWLANIAWEGMGYNICNI